MKQYRHVIWDWNGTLFDDAWLCVDIMNCLLQKRQLPLLDAAAYEQVFTFPVQDYYTACGFNFVHESYAEVAAEFVSLYDRRRFACALQPAARHVLATLTQRDITQSVLSAYEQSRLEEMIAFTQLGGTFSHIIGLSDYYAASKVELGRNFVRELPCDPADVVFIGDTVHDAETAEAMGVDCLLIPCGHYTKERLLTANAHVVDSLVDVLTQKKTQSVL
ncbi:MAG TPA: HAD family hydrolase [Armatimonadota bacterium]|nr:HAD family hydrolase [Armatimonadota bacterium]